MRADLNDGSKYAAATLAAALLLFGAAPASANPSMSDDFQRMTQWLSNEMSHGLAFSAGATFDPPHEVVDKRLAPDLSLGMGKIPFDKSKFPVPETPALNELNAANIFPSEVMFPNLVMHLRAGLPWRSDFAVRVANMTTPPGYRLSETTSGKGQSNSIGFTLRRHFFGGSEYPLLTVAAHMNHVYGRFLLKTNFRINDVNGFSADSDVLGDLQWNMNSLGLNAVTSKTFGVWTPFIGFGYNRASGSIRTRLEATPNTPLIAPIIGEGSSKPEANQARFIFGGEVERPWAHFFFNTELKVIGISKARTWIAHAGMQLPFKIGIGGSQGYKDSARRRAKFVKVKIVDDDEIDTLRSAPNDLRWEKDEEEAPVKKPKRRRVEPHREVFRGGSMPLPANDATPELIFIQ